MAKIGGILYSAKGDILVGSAAGTYDKLAAGANGGVLVADSNQTLGVRYGLPVQNTMNPENMLRTEAFNGVIMASGNVQIWAFTPYYTTTITKVYATLFAVLATSSAVHRMGIGTFDGTASYTPLAETADLASALGTAGNVDTKVGGVFSTARGLASSVTLTAGTRYAFAYCGAATTMPKFQGNTISKGDASYAGNVMTLRKTSQTDLPTATLSTINVTMGVLARFWGEA